MTRKSATRGVANLILNRLSHGDFGLLKPHLKRIKLPLRTELEEIDKPIKHIYFVEDGIVSVVANGSGKRSIEVGIIGHDGMTGLAVVMGADRAANRIFVQVAGSGLRIPAKKLQEAIAQSATLHRGFLRYAHAFMTQTARTALANGRSKIEERLARWLLMAHDRLKGDDMQLTHEFLSVMLGVRRAGVTEALNILSTAGFVRSRRGVISILDRKGLERTSDGLYLRERPYL